MLNTIKTFCPVCKDFLGLRRKDTLTDLFCKECDVVFYWHPNDKIPTNNKGIKKPKCGCGLCNR